MRIPDLAIQRASRYYPKAEELNEEGVRLFGPAWLGANEELVSIFRSWGMDVSDQAIRQLGMLLCLRLGKHYTRKT